jgi:hypothetical protein
MTLTRYVDHEVLAAFAVDRVNLPLARVRDYRDQGGRMRKKLEAYIQAHADYALVKMLNSGSVAKGTALSTASDFDLAVYVKRAAAPEGNEELVNWLRDRLREAYSNLDDDQFVPQQHCVTVKFRTPSLADVDVVPVLYDGEADNIGYLIVKDTGARVRTSISRHLDFIAARKGPAPSNFAQVVRLLKWWVAECKERDPDLRFKSFLVELMCAHLHDTGTDFSDYYTAMEAFFTYVVVSGLRERLAFEDYYGANELPGSTPAAIEVFDPVNPENNVAVGYSETDRARIVTIAEAANEAVADAAYATTKARSVDDWQDILGPAFRG